MSGVFRNW